MENQTKNCSRCHTVKELSLFGKSAKGKNGFAPHCKDCEKIRKAKYESQSPEKMKSYLKSYYEKTIDYQKENRRKYYIENKEKFIERAKDRYSKTLSEKKNYDKEYRAKHKERIAEYKKQYANENAEQIAERMRIYRQENAEKLLSKKSEYAKNNRTKINARASIYVKKRCAVDPLFKLKKNTRKMVSRYMLGEKSKRTQEIIGCSYEELKIHIENQFTEGMSWDNYGINGWHIDHIKPLAMAANQDEVIASNHYTNLQPLWCLDNLSKGATFEGVNYKTKQ